MRVPSLGWEDAMSAGGHGNPLQSSGLENPLGRGAWWAAVHGVTKSQTQPKRLSTQYISLDGEVGCQQQFRAEPLSGNIAKEVVFIQ